MDRPNFNEQVEHSIKEYWDLDALSDYKGETFQYKDIARIIEKLHIIFEYSNVKQGDKIAICGRNCAHWGAAFLATLTYGAVAVPVLHEFTAEQIHNIVNHCEAKLLFAGDQVWKNLNADEMPRLEGILNIADYSLLVGRTEKVVYARAHLNQLFGERYPMNFRKHHVAYYKGMPDELAVINYTSGTTSRSKGFMIPYRALWSNLEFAKEVLLPHMAVGNNIISMLPMAHMYGMSFEFLFEFCTGCHIHFLTKKPSPNVLFTAFAELKPRIIIAVPLIIEKIIRKSVLPKIQGTTVKMLLKVPLVRQKIKDKICEQLKAAFGGNFYEIIIGGAAFNHEIEMLLHYIGFNYTVGYGTTECAPIISYADWTTFRPGSCGRPAPRMEIKIDSNDPQHTVGEILTRGTNVMLGYYKNEQATQEVLRDGWYHTGDLGVVDEEGNLFIKGRSKNMLLGASGQNIYPEEIEVQLNNLTLVGESIVIQKNEKLYGLVYPDYEEARNLGLQDADLKTIMEQNRTELNSMLPTYSQLSGIKIFHEEFEKTPKKSIKRYLYTDTEI
ncbi:MAG: AMP-binding protein [Paraprevotella sp.]|nr:AMP-binding protein [Paraprevotella sp.]